MYILPFNPSLWVPPLASLLFSAVQSSRIPQGRSGLPVTPSLAVFSALCLPQSHSGTLPSPLHPPEITEMKPLTVLPCVFAVVRFMSFLKPCHYYRFLGLGTERWVEDVLITPPSLTSNSLLRTPMTSALPVLLGSLFYWFPLPYWWFPVGVSLFSILSLETILSTGSFKNVYLYADCSLSAPPSLTWLLNSRLFIQLPIWNLEHFRYFQR